MSFADKYNKGSKFTFKTPEKADFKKLSDFAEGTTLVLKAIYINSKGKYQPHPVFVTETHLVDIPAGNTDTVNKILEDDEAIADINAGKVGFVVEKYTSKKYGEQTGFRFVDL